MLAPPRLNPKATHETPEADADAVLAAIAPRLEEAIWWPPGTYISAQHSEPLPRWTQFEPVQLTKPPYEARLAKCRAAGLPEPLNDSYIDECTAFVNSRYCVLIHDAPARTGCPALWHVQIQRRDGQPAGPERYRDFMRVRDELIGEEHEAVEMYPARSRETDVANIYHLWVVQSDADEFAVGFK